MPSILISDASLQFLQLSKENQEFRMKTTCWAHSSRNIKAKCQSLKKEERKMLYNDTCFLQLMNSELQYQSALKLFYSKYINLLSFDNTIAKFKQYHINKNGNWYEGFDTWSASTNNCLENFNRILKQKYDLYKKSNILEFLSTISVIINDLVIKYDNFLSCLDKIYYDEYKYIEISEFYFELILETENYKIISY